MEEDDALVEMRRSLADLRVMRQRAQEKVDNFTRQIVDLEAEIGRAMAERATRPAEPMQARRYGQVRAEIMRMIAGSIDGLESALIGRALKDRYGDLVAHRTHLTTLSRLKEGGLAYKMDGRWRLTAAGHRDLHGD